MCGRFNKFRLNQNIITAFCADEALGIVRPYVTLYLCCTNRATGACIYKKYLIYHKSVLKFTHIYVCVPYINRTDILCRLGNF